MNNRTTPTGRELAAALGVDPARITRMAQKGMPTSSIEAARAWVRANVRPRTPASPARPESPGSEDFQAARTRRETAAASLAQLKLQEQSGRLVERDQALAHVFKLARTERDAWLNWPARISAQLAAKLNADPHTMHVALEAAVREHLLELGELRPKVD